MRFGSLFAGIGGLDLGLERAGMRCAWQVERNPHAVKILEKNWPNVRRHRNVKTFPPVTGDWSCDLICGGFPCQPVSNAGKKKAQADPRWLWPEFARILRVLRPRYALLENVPGLLLRGFGDVLRDLATLGYDAEWSVLSACQLGAPHSRERVFLVAYPNGVRWGSSGIHFERQVKVRHGQFWKTAQGWKNGRSVELWFDSLVSLEDGSEDAGLGGRMVDGFSRRLDRIERLGNAVVPQMAEWLGEAIMELDHGQVGLKGKNT